MEQSTVSSDLADVARRACQDEFTDYNVYLVLSRYERNGKFKEALISLGETEKGHYDFWRKYSPDARVRAVRLRIYFIQMLRVLLGLTFTLKFLERHENAVVRRYKQVEHYIPPEDRTRFDQMVADEEHHESYLMGGIEEGRVKYMAFIILGLADAVVEVAAIHAGSLGIYRRTELAGLAGIIAGMAASIAMASAAYAQAQQGFSGSARRSAIYTGISYLVTAILLAFPYFLTPNQYIALGSSLAVGMALVAFITYYDTIISARAFMRQFIQLGGIILGATAALYVIGVIIGNVLPNLLG
jgi:VIT1/CCC1 family predicted Fe2+/Mn2+ transporter